MGLKSILLLGSGCLALLSTTAQAQSTQDTGVISTSRTGADQGPPAAQTGEVVVTGSRIAKPNLDQPTPISTLSQLQIQDAGTANLGDIIAQLPEAGTNFGVRANANGFGNQAGVSAIDLHNLGVSRTLVLVDGQRHVNGDIQSDAVDINSIPAGLVDHVEVITGGASAIYGSDAVSGVVNIILKKGFEGVEINAQGGEFDEGFGSKYNAYGTLGHNFLDGKLNVTVSGFWNHEIGIGADQPSYDNNYGTITNPRDLTGAIDPTFYTSKTAIIGDGIPDHLVVPNVGSEFVTRTGVLFDPATFQPITEFNRAGQPAPVPGRTGYNSFAFAQVPYGSTANIYYPDAYSQVSSPIDTHGFEFTSNYKATSHLHFGLDIKGVETSVENVIQPDFSFLSYGIAQDNAFITPAIASVLAPIYAAGEQPLYGAFIDDNRTQRINRQTYRFVGTVGGDFDLGLTDLKWDGALNYGQSKDRLSISGIQYTGNFQNALDSVIDPATGQPACRSNVPSAQPAGYTAPTNLTGAACVPFNPFGSQQTAAMDAYSLARETYRDSLTQEVANLNLNADTSRFFKLPGGPIAVAFGGEYRMERTFENNDPDLVNGLTDNLAANSGGGFNVAEGFVEVSVPVFHHSGLLLDELSLDGAFRGAHYSTVGEADAYKVSGTYGPVSWFKLRGTYSSAVRAPNITEAYSPTQSTYFNVADPCSTENITQNVNYAKNCASAGIPANFTSNTNASIIGQSSGNLNAAAEHSLSYTVGGVLEPTFIPHLSISMDYYSILIKDAITLVAAQDIINNCYNSAAGLSSQYCSLFTRDPTTNNINFVQTTYVNAAKLYTDGVEMQVDYTTPVEGVTSRWRYSSWLTGRLGLNLDANYILRLRNFPFQNDPSQYNVWEGVISTTEGDVPQLKMLGNITYAQGPWHIDYRLRYIGRAARYDKDPTATEGSEYIDQPYAGAKTYHDITVRYDLGGRFHGAQVYVGCNNLFGDQPPLGLVDSGGVNFTTNASSGYDLGRAVFGGIHIRR